MQCTVFVFNDQIAFLEDCFAGGLLLEILPVAE
jgi:hypothetical protein